MAEKEYLIPEPTTEIETNTNGTLLFSANGQSYAYKTQDDQSDWWAIGMIAKNKDNQWFPCIVSDSEKHAASLSIFKTYGGEVIKKIATVYPITYGEKTYYTSYDMYGASSSNVTNNTIPITDGSISYSTDDLTEIATATLDAYVKSGGELPGVPTYKTSWVRKLIEGAWQKTFAFAHAKTVYTDYANKKTLSDKLSEIDTEIGNKANKTEIPTELPANGGNSATVNGHTVKSDVPENAVFTDTVYDDTEVKEEIASINSDLGGLSFSVSGTTLSITDGTNTWTLSQ